MGHKRQLSRLTKHIRSVRRAIKRYETADLSMHKLELEKQLRKLAIQYGTLCRSSRFRSLKGMPKCA